jgi:hypothetical protein
MFVQLLKDHMGQKAGFRFDTDDAVAQALIASGHAEAIEDDPLAPMIAKSMETMLAGLTTGLSATIDATLKQFANAQTKSNKNAVKAIFGEGGSGDPKKTFGQFLLAVRTGDTKALEEMGSRFVEPEGVTQKTDMSTQTGAKGGYLVPTEMYDGLMALVREKSIVRGRATVIPMGSNNIQIPSLDVTTAQSAGDSAFLGGVVCRWTEEATTLNETEPNLKQVELRNYELSGYSIASNTLLADSAVGLEAMLTNLFSPAIHGLAVVSDQATFGGFGQSFGPAAEAALEGLRTEEGEDSAEGAVRRDAVGQFGQAGEPVGLVVAADLDLDPAVVLVDDGADGQGDEVPE